MNDLTKQAVQLPDTIEDLTQFVLVGKAKLQAYMIKLQTVNKLSVAQEIRDQTLKEAQEVSTAVIAAEVRIGELLQAIPKASGGVNQYNKEENSERTEKSKSKIASEMGYSRHDVSDYQQMAKNPEVVQAVIDNAIANGDVVTKSQVLKEIKAAKEQAKAEAEAHKTTREKFAEQKADRLMAENEKLKAKLAEQPEPETIKIEIPPADYKDLKKQAAAYKADFSREREKHGETLRKVVELEAELKELQEHLAVEQLHGDLLSGAAYFIAQCGSFIRDVAGYVWIADKLAEIPEREREGYVRATHAVYAWAQTLLQTIERDNEYGKPELQKLTVQGGGKSAES